MFRVFAIIFILAVTVTNMPSSTAAQSGETSLQLTDEERLSQANRKIFIDLAGLQHETEIGDVVNYLRFLEFVKKIQEDNPEGNFPPFSPFDTEEKTAFFWAELN